MATGRSGRTAPRVGTIGRAEAKPSAPAVDRTSAVLDDLLGKTEQVLSEAEKPDLASIDLAAELLKVGEHTEQETMRLVQTDQLQALRLVIKDDHERITSGTLDELLTVARTQEGTLAEAIASVQASWAALGISVDNMNELNEDEKSLIDMAQAEVDEIDAEIQGLQDKTIVLFRQSKIDDAQTRRGIAAAKVDEAKVAAARLADARVRSANYEQSFQKIILMSDRSADRLHTTYTETQERLRITSERHGIVLELKEKAATALEKAKEDLAKEEAKLSEAEHILTNELVAGTPAYVAKEREVSKLRESVETINGKCKTATGVFHSKERFALQLDVLKASLQKLGSNVYTMEAVLRSDTEERVKAFAARIQAQKTAEEHEAGMQIAEVGIEQDANNMSAAAGFSMAADRAWIAFAERQGEHMARNAATKASFEQAHAASREKALKIFQDIAARYGLDVREEQFLTHAKTPVAPPETA